jgi:hypothetical protein
MMSTTILQSLKLKFNLCMEKQKWQIALRGKLNQIAKFRGKLNQNLVYRVI